MGILDDAIREHLELRRKHGASEAEISKKETEALSPARREAPVALAEEPPSDEKAWEADHEAGASDQEVVLTDEPGYVEADVDRTAHLADEPTYAEAEPLAAPTELDAGPAGDQSDPFVERIAPVEPPSEDVVMIDHVAPVEPPEGLEPSLAVSEDPFEPEGLPADDSADLDGPGSEAGIPETADDEPRPRLRVAFGGAFSRRADVQSSTPLPPPSTHDFERIEPVAGDVHQADELVEPTIHFEPGPDEPEAALKLEPYADPASEADPQAEPSQFAEPEPEPEPDGGYEPADETLIQERPLLAPKPSSSLDAPQGDEPDDDMLEDTPDFLQETPEHDRLWFEQKPPRDFDFDD